MITYLGAAVVILLSLLFLGCADDAGVGSPTPANSEFSLPWTAGETWFFIGGPHCDSSGPDCGAQPRYALDFAPIAPLYGNACRPGVLEDFWVTAAAPGVVQIAERSLVEIEHRDGLRSGYYHLVSSSIQISPGDEVEAGDRLGHPSCEHHRGGAALGPHVHFYFCHGAPAGAPCLGAQETLEPIAGAFISGWRVVSLGVNYEGKLVREREERIALNLRCDDSEAASAECGEDRNDLSTN